MSALTGSRFDPARYLFEAYFYQDCLVDDPNWQAVVTRFRNEHDPGIVRETREALLDLLASTDDRRLSGYVGEWSFFELSATDLTTRAWIESIIHILAGGEHLALKLLETLHLSVPERRTLPHSGIPFSALVAAVSGRLDDVSWFPAAIDAGSAIGEGARIERRGSELWVHEQHESGVGRFGPIQSRRVASIQEAVRGYIEANHGSPIEGVHIDWAA